MIIFGTKWQLWLLKNLKLHVWLTLYFCWTVLLCLFVSRRAIGFYNYIFYLTESLFEPYCWFTRVFQLFYHISASRETFTSALPVFMPLIVFSCFIALFWILNRNVWYFHWDSGFRIRFIYFIVLRKYPVVSAFFECFYQEWLWISSEVSSLCGEKYFSS